MVHNYATQWRMKGLHLPNLFQSTHNFVIILVVILLAVLYQYFLLILVARSDQPCRNQKTVFRYLQAINRNHKLVLYMALALFVK